MERIQTEQEEWRLIKNSKNYYVSSLGRVAKEDKYLLRQSNNNAKKYWRVGIVMLDSNVQEHKSVHRLVAEAFIPNPDNKPQINHIDGNKDNNKVDNLEWVTQEENIQHRINVLNIKNWKEGQDCNFAVLTEEQVKEIPRLLERMSQVDIAKMYNVGKTTIAEIVAGRSWKHLNLSFPNKQTTSKYKNVFYRKDKDKWGFRININKVSIQSCKFNSEDEAFEELNKIKLRYSPNQNESSDTQS